MRDPAQNSASNAVTRSSCTAFQRTGTLQTGASTIAAPASRTYEARASPSRGASSPLEMTISDGVAPDAVIKEV